MTFHLAIRTPAKERVSGQYVSVVHEHNAAFDQQGRTAFGKIGARLSDRSVRLLRQQIKEGTTTKLYVIFKEKNGYNGFSAELSDVGHVGRNRTPTDMFPDYYDAAGLAPTTFFILRTPLIKAPIDQLLLSRGQNLTATIARCRTVQMLVREPESL